MRIRRVLRTSPKNLILLLLTCVIIWNEFIALKFYSLFWNISNNNDNKYTILIVSDPHLLGYRDEPISYGWLSRWDSDRYLYRGFSQAFNAVKPNLVIFLGDIFDEGVWMNNVEFDITMERFKAVFPDTLSTPTLYFPGDNDIGGEMEPVYDRLVNKFQRYFSNSFSSVHAEEQFFDLASVFPMASSKIEVINRLDDSKGKLLFSHIPLVRTVNRELNEALAEYDPDLILSAHDHTAEIYIRDRNSAQYHRFLLKDKINFILSSKQPIVEIQNPTCNYRMQVPYMGYGVLTLVNESPATAEYTVLWIPGRFPQLFSYVVCLIIIIYYFLRRIIGLTTTKFVNLSSTVHDKRAIKMDE